MIFLGVEQDAFQLIKTKTKGKFSLKSQNLWFLAKMWRKRTSTFQGQSTVPDEGTEESPNGEDIPKVKKKLGFFFDL